jgi:hypothetical protein
MVGMQMLHGRFTINTYQNSHVKGRRPQKCVSKETHALKLQDLLVQEKGGSATSV